MSHFNLLTHTDLSSLPTQSLLRLLSKRDLYSLPSYETERTRYPSLSEVPDESSSRFPEMSMIPATDSRFNADLEALDWTLKGDLLQLRSSYSMTFDHQLQEIEKLKTQVEIYEREMRVHKNESGIAQQKLERQLKNLSKDYEQINSKYEILKTASDSKESEINKLTKSLEASDQLNSRLNEQYRALQYEMETRNQKSSVTIQSLTRKIEDLTQIHSDQLEKVRIQQAEETQNEVEKVRKSLKNDHENEVEQMAKTFELKKEALQQTISELNSKVIRLSAEHRATLEKMKMDHDRELSNFASRDKDRLQSELQDLQRSLTNKHEFEIDSMRRKLNNLSQEHEDKKRKLENEVESSKHKEYEMRAENECLKKKFREELEAVRRKMESESKDMLKEAEKRLVEKHQEEISKLKHEKKDVEENLADSDAKLTDIRSKFLLLEEQLKKLEQRTINSIEKTSWKLLKTLGIADPRPQKSENVSSALEYLRWTAKETINTISTNQMLVLDICDKWKKFEKEKNQEVKRLREQFDHETEDLIEFSKNEIGESYKHNLATFKPIASDYD